MLAGYDALATFWRSFSVSRRAPGGRKGSMSSFQKLNSRLASPSMLIFKTMYRALTSPKSNPKPCWGQSQSPSEVMGTRTQSENLCSRCGTPRTRRCRPPPPSRSTPCGRAPRYQRTCRRPSHSTQCRRGASHLACKRRLKLHATPRQIFRKHCGQFQ